MSLVALDLFAGTGWGVACRILGIEEHGVELMPEAVATREANGMSTLYRDVWHGLEHELAVPDYDLLIASPPCQTFSMAGNGKGRRALDEVLALIDSRAYLDVAELRAFGEAYDMRTALVLTPLAHIARDAPLYVVLEQVPQVLPVWERYAVELRRWGYSVVTGVLNAEQYGVPQTRKRAILIARADGVEASMPTPTHSRYYPTDKARLDPGVKPWVSMATALRWNLTPGQATVRSSFGKPKTHHDDGSHAGGHHTFDPAAAPGHTVTGIVSGWQVEVDDDVEWVPEESAKYFHPMTYGRRAIHPGDEPAPTIRGVMRDMPENYEPHPGDAVVFQGHQKPDSKRTSGEPDAYQTRSAELPAPAITSGSRSAKWRHGETGEPINLDPSKPATTVQGDPWLTAREHHHHGEQSKTSTRVTVAEAARLQTYPDSFDWSPMVPVLRKGIDTGRLAPLSKTKAFLQIGNAVPPLLALRCLGVIVESLALTTERH